MNLTKVISSSLNDLGQRLVKVLRMGKSDVQDVLESSPFGIDSNPVKDMIAIYSPTGENGKPVIMGYVKRDQLAEVGELRIYSTNTNGAEVFYTWLKADGTMEIGGSSKNMVRYQELESAFNELKDDLNTLISTFNTHVHTGNLGAPTPYTGSPVTASTADITPAKINEIKTL